MLRVNMSLGIRVVNRMLERGALRRVERLRQLNEHSDTSTTQVEENNGILLDLMGNGTRLHIGDAHVWSWYRGSSVGPYPCMSALFSLEMFLDELVNAGVPVSKIAAWVLRDAKTLASVGLSYGFLVRHIERVTNELDDFLSVPEIWALELGRTAKEGLLHVQGADPPDRVGGDRRRWTPREVAMQLVIAAVRHGDDAALKRLRDLSFHLVARAGGVNAPPQVRQWAAYLDSYMYTMQEQDDRIVIQVRVPEDIVEELAPAQAYSERVSEMYRLQARYRLQSVIHHIDTP